MRRGSVYELGYQDAYVPVGIPNLIYEIFDNSSYRKRAEVTKRVVAKFKKKTKK